MMFEKIKTKENIIVKEGSKVDVVNPNGNNFLPGVIGEIEQNADLKILHITIERK